MGFFIGMGDRMGKVEIDARGRITIPVELREELNFLPGDKLTIEVSENHVLKLRKSPTKKEIFNNLVGCIKTPRDRKVTIEEIKNIWKTEK
jgi:AbrB family looped-hinge helix DNA binding protein